MTAEEQILDTLEVLDLSIEARRKYQRLLNRVLGDTLEEKHATLRAMEGLTPAPIRDACEIYKSLHSEEVPTLTIQTKETS